MWKPRARWRSAISFSSLSRTNCRKSRCSHELCAKTKGRPGGALASRAQGCAEGGCSGWQRARKPAKGEELKNRSSSMRCSSWNDGTSRRTYAWARRRMRCSQAASRAAASCCSRYSASSATDRGRRWRRRSHIPSSSSRPLLDAGVDFFVDVGVPFLEEDGEVPV